MSRSDRFQILAKVVEIANTTVDIGERLESILAAIRKMMEARAVMLFMREAGKDHLYRAHAWPRAAGEGAPLMVSLGDSLMGRPISHREPLIHILGAPEEDSVLGSLGQTGEMAALFPVMDDNRDYGVLALFFPPRSALEADDHRLLQMVAREMGGVLRNYSLWVEAKRRIAELSVISELGRAAVSTIEVSELLDVVSSISAKLLGAQGGLVFIKPVNSDNNVLLSHYGRVPPEALGAGRLECIESIARDSQAELSRSAYGDPGEGRSGRDRLCAPLAFKGAYQGYLCVFYKVFLAKGSVPGFNSEDLALLNTMVSMVSAALENALTYQQVEDLAQHNEEMVGALATLHEISTVLMTTMDFNQTVRILLHSVIHPAGLDFDRVILFLADEDQTVLTPMAELGKDGAPGLRRELKSTLMDVIQEGQELTGPSDPHLKKLRVRIRSKGCLLSQTVYRRAVVREDHPAENPEVGPALLEALGNCPFVSVPMFAKGKTVGLLVVNNHASGRVITDRDMKLLAMLANQGGLALETSRLYQNLENANRELAHMRNRLLEADKLAALGEVAAGVAHEIRNPLVSIGGFTRRIKKKVGDSSDITPYLDVIIEETSRLEKTLNEMLDFSSDSRDHFEEHSMEVIMEQSLELLKRELTEHSIHVVKEFTGSLPSVFCDDRQIKHVFLNLYLNAVQAMGDNGSLRLRTYSVMREGKQFVAGEVTDSGGGIPMEVIHNIFNPFFTTKDTGSGLGLSIVHKIVTRHFGQVEVHNREGEGASFLVTLPAAEEGRAYLK